MGVIVPAKEFQAAPIDVLLNNAADDLYFIRTAELPGAATAVKN